VELERGTRHCPLCAVEVLNPKEEPQAEYIPAYPEKLVLPKATNRRYVAFLISMTILIPNIVCSLTNLLFPASGSWARYVNAASAFLWVLLVLPWFWKRFPAYLAWLLDTLALCLFVYLFYGLGEKPWYFTLALPLILGLSAMVLVWLFWLRRKKHAWPSIVIAVLLCVVAFSVFMDGLIYYFIYGRLAIGVSLIVVASCVALIGFFAYVRKSGRFRAWLSRRFFV